MLNIFKRKVSINEYVEQAQETKNAVILDVRTQGEYLSGHIPSSINIPLDRLDQINISKDSQIFLYCLSGARSGHAEHFLKSKGYTNAKNIGGIQRFDGSLERGANKK